MIKIYRQANAAESVLLKYKKDNLQEKTAAYVFFMKHICGIELFPTQIMQAEQLFRFPYTVEVKPPRSGKSMGKAGINLYECCMNPLEDLRIYTPKHEIGKDALNYQYDWIEHSPVLRSYIRVKNGKRQVSSVSYEFMNRSNARIISIAGKIEGHNVTIADIMEFDLWPWEIYQDDVMRRLGAKNENGLPTRVRIDGTILGQQNLHKILNDKKNQLIFQNLMYTHKNNILNLPAGIKMDIDFMLACGVLDPKITEFQKAQMSPDEIQRSFYLNFTESTNFIWSAYLTAVMRKAAQWGLDGEPFEKGGSYNKKGIVACGFDCGHAGQKKKSSHYSLQFYEQVGNYRRWLNGFRWPAAADTGKLERDILEILAYYRPDGGYADGLKHNFVASINDKAFHEGLTDIDREEFPDQTPSNWEQWWFSPIWNNGKNKHFMYDSLQLGIHKGTCFYPYYPISDDRPEAKAMRKLKQTLLNIRREEKANTYPSYFGFDEEIGDDDSDAAGMANLWLDLHVEPAINMNLIRASNRQTRTSLIRTHGVNALDIEREDFNNF